MFSKNDWSSKTLDEKVNAAHLALVGILFFVFWPLGIIALFLKKPLSEPIKQYIQKYDSSKKTIENKKSSVTNKPHHTIEDARLEPEIYQPDKITPSVGPGQDMNRNILAVVGFVILVVIVGVYFLAFR